MKIAVLLSRVPYPLEKGDKLRAYHQIRILSQQHDIYLFALNDGKIHPEAERELAPFCKEMHFFPLSLPGSLWHAFCFFLQGKPLQCGFFYRKPIHKRLRAELERIQADSLYFQLIRTAEYATGLPYRKTLDYQDVFSKGIDRIIPKSAWWKRGVLRAEYRRVSQYEHDVFDRFDHCTIITQVDRDLIRHPRSKEIVVIPNGVDTEHYTSAPHRKTYDLIFTGNMGYLPNVEAATYIAKEIFPALRQKYPDIRIALCGANPSPRVLALENKHITVTGWVEDMRDYYAQSRIFIAPMHLGTGLQNKLLEAMSMGIPCITSPLAAAPLNATENHHLVVCNSTLGYIDAIDNLLKDKAYYERIAENGHAFVQEKYNWEHTTRLLEKLLTPPSACL